MKIKAIKIISFILIFCILLYSVSRVLRFKYDDGIKQLDSFYKLENNSIDVLILGSSHAYANIYPFYLYSLYGISSYDMCSPAQPIWNTYFYLKEALKTQKPKLIILESLMILLNKEYYNSFIHRTFYGLNFSKTFIENIKTSRTKKEWVSFINPFYQYHNRYSDLTFNDFIKKDSYKYFKGNIFYIRSNINNIPIEYHTTNIGNLYWKSEKYYRIIIELAQKNQIPILIIKSPYNVYTYEQKLFKFNDTNYIQEQYNAIMKIANEYGIHFINFNFNYGKYNLDFNTDFSDKWGHLNYKGAEKFTRYLGKYLKENYDLPDRRGDPKYYSWEMNAKYEYKGIYNIELKQSKNLNEYIEKVKNAEDYVIGITMLGNYKKNDAIIKNISTNFNINNIYLKNASYVVDNNKLIYSSSGSNRYLFYDEIGSYTDLVADSGQKLSINRTNYIKTKNGINMVIYDKFTEVIVDNIYLEYKGNSINPTIKR
ncbi:SGNH/GDSL hydrolase family protein [uncultured Brachyspira sp.]|uniref:SGNH/GDSL hydrolase family protein n=1 Tax=uncultured Brachyspira sp. TaxID=221953 RepID=UPI002602FAFE|nr:SGNH/GDSL hydrolase family protein [uncultured Brachyspira sp.]